MADFNHTDYTDELNRIIAALTGIRDDIRLIRRRSEDSEIGMVTSQVLNDFQSALLAISMSGQGAGDAERVRRAINEGTGLAGGSGVPSTVTGDDQERRSDILSALGIQADADNEDPRSIYRIDGLYYREAKPTNAPDDGLRGSLPVPQPFVADGGSIGYHSIAGNRARAGAPSGADDIDFGASKKRWPAPRPEDVTAVPVATPNADLVNPVTGDVVPRTIKEITDDISSGGDSPPPAIDYDNTGVA